ncbi:MAG: hypothetical protein LBV23_07265 [Deltaproteobacteria bacterium]|nr:hypothetical protein [Deltaproteobacteria bacterium]
MSDYSTIQLAPDCSFCYVPDIDKFRQALLYYGFFCLLSNTPLSSLEILAMYQAKDIIENSFEDVKNDISMKKMLKHFTCTTDGKTFCSFIALIIVSKPGVKLRKFLKKKCMSKARLITEIEKICIGTKDSPRRLLAPLTKVQRTIMKEPIAYLSKT